MGTASFHSGGLLFLACILYTQWMLTSVRKAIAQKSLLCLYFASPTFKQFIGALPPDEVNDVDILGAIK